ncbi:Gfo/Idh/MocA family protein [Paenibacillus eucommiae]|uniref:Dehydrogenase n=1 Tax=Paenibacillus eucommiae TaxID=1355755 RepID=A0ABS4ISA0_9BACL|nr:Gfo/Idh/MocA family oxidoreductase [Paenibacillus eucommiae]MBP1989459.1 putative dehydrogenase [Paenibacillus eucommiae]
MNIGIIGYGHRIRWMVNEIRKVEPACHVTAITDVRNGQIMKELGQEKSEGVMFYDTPEEMIEAGNLDGILIGTRCSLHTGMALKVLPSRIPLFMEKPVATTYEDLVRLKSAYETHGSEVVVSFPLRNTPLAQLAKEIIGSGKIGTVEHVQAVNNVASGGIYYHGWYRDEQETGGLFLQKATHDFDYITYLLGLAPTAICAMKSKQIFKGTRPGGLTCTACDEQHVCLDSTARSTAEEALGEYCCFAEDTGNEDSGSAIIQYESGMHASYSQNFFARKKAGGRGARLLGYKGTIEFDWYTNLLRVYMHHTNRVETYEVLPDNESHGGGDAVLAKNFIEVMKGSARSSTPLEDGLLSALMCLKARDSAETHTFQRVDWSQR